ARISQWSRVHPSNSPPASEVAAMTLNPLRRVLLSTILLATLAQAAVAATPDAPTGPVRLHMPPFVALKQAAAIATDPRGEQLISEPEFAFLQDAANGR